MRQLHITNGDSAAELLRAAGLDGQIVPWRDVLHLGPVPRCDSLTELSAVRAEFLATMSGQSLASIRASFAARDDLFATAPTFDRTVLWFEHDLYDQLQLLQIVHGLDELAVRPWLICIGEHPEIKPFYGLGQLDARQIEALAPTAAQIEPDAMKLASQIWRAVTAPDPLELNRYTSPTAGSRTHESLRFVAPALERYLQEFPWTTDGLTRSERTALALCRQHNGDPQEMFRASASTESAPFLGDSGFAYLAAGLSHPDAPLLRTADGEQPTAETFFTSSLKLTQLGDDVLDGSSDWLQQVQREQSFGGAELGADRFRYSPEERRLVVQRR